MVSPHRLAMLSSHSNSHSKTLISNNLSVCHTVNWKHKKIEPPGPTKQNFAYIAYMRSGMVVANKAYALQCDKPYQHSATSGVGVFCIVSAT